MARLDTIARKVRSKNAGPFWLTIDIFCDDVTAFKAVSDGLTTKQVASVFNSPTEAILRFDISSLNVVKFSLPRPEVQGSTADRDLHGASWAALLSDIEIEADLDNEVRDF